MRPAFNQQNNNLTHKNMTTINTAHTALKEEKVFQSTVEVEVSKGIGIHLIGMADIAVKESLLRTITAIQSLGYRIPGKKLIINICPTFLHKNTTGFDLPIALGILIESGQLEINTEGLVFHGELGLDGSVRQTGAENAILAYLEGAGDDYTLVGGLPYPRKDDARYKGFGDLGTIIEYLRK